MQNIEGKKHHVCMPLDPPTPKQNLNVHGRSLAERLCGDAGQPIEAAPRPRLHREVIPDKTLLRGPIWRGLKLFRGCI